MATFGISKEIVVTLKYYYEKNISVVETMLKCLLFKDPRGRPNTYLKLTFRSSQPEWFYQKSVPKIFAKVSGKHMRKILFLIKCKAGGLKPSLKRDFDSNAFSCKCCRIS